ncbi:MAG TPA: VCBS repeat-containing protein [Thermoanaerobaculia bacterium]|nr:VCBS repeat-containing protein [Thermoanaerobaculia bacterium]
MRLTSCSGPWGRLVLAGLLVVGLGACSHTPPTRTTDQAGSAPSAGPAIAAPAAPAASDPKPPPRIGELGKTGSTLEQLPENVKKEVDTGAEPAAQPKRQRSGIEPPDGVWLEDELGNQFYVERMKRYEGKYRWISETRVKYLGVEVDIVGADDDWFYVKVYRVTERSRPPVKTEPDPADLARIAATYQIEAKTEDRLFFQRFDQGLPAEGQWRNGFVLADLNEDGFIDIVHAPPRKMGGLPIIFLGDGKGSWTPWRTASFKAPFDYGDVAVGDLNGDGHLDIVLAIHLRGVRALVNDGSGNFSDWSRGLDYQVPGQGEGETAFSSRALKLVDWNGDGRLDILALGEGPKLGGAQSNEQRRKGVGKVTFVSDGPVVYLNQGDGSWVKKWDGEGTEQLFGDAIDVGDFNADGRIDFVTASNRMMRRDLVNLGDRAGEDWTAVDVPEVRPGAYVRSVVAEDFDRDGRDDLALSYVSFELGVWRTGIDILHARPVGWERRIVFARDGRLAIYAIGVGDLDADGNLDIVGVDGDGDMLTFLGESDGSFRQELSPELVKPRGRCRGYRIQLADLDGQAGDEVVVNFADESSAYFDPDRCPNSGGLAAFKPIPRPR